MRGSRFNVLCCMTQGPPKWVVRCNEIGLDRSEKGGLLGLSLSSSGTLIPEAFLHLSPAATEMASETCHSKGIEHGSHEAGVFTL